MPAITIATVGSIAAGAAGIITAGAGAVAALATAAGAIWALGDELHEMYGEDVANAFKGISGQINELTADMGDTPARKLLSGAATITDSAANAAIGDNDNRIKKINNTLRSINTTSAQIAGGVQQAGVMAGQAQTAWQGTKGMSTGRRANAMLDQATEQLLKQQAILKKENAAIRQARRS
jgi:uncharacterized phage infection (PIP) family protein YhgE